MTREEMNVTINSIMKKCESENIWAEYEDDSIGLLLNYVSFQITGDWKHDHIKFNHVVKNLFSDIYKISECDILDSEDDYYISTHVIYFADEESSKLLDDMSKLFN